MSLSIIGRAPRLIPHGLPRGRAANAALLAEWEAGASAGHLARRYGVRSGTIYRRLFTARRSRGR